MVDGQEDRESFLPRDIRKTKRKKGPCGIEDSFYDAPSDISAKISPPIGSSCFVTKLVMGLMVGLLIPSLVIMTTDQHVTTDNVRGFLQMIDDNAVNIRRDF